MTADPERGVRSTRSTVGAGFANALLGYAISKGADRDELLKRSGIAAADLGHQDRRLPLTNFVVLMRSAIELSGDPALALHFGEAVSVASFSVAGHVSRAAPTMWDALAISNLYVRLIIDIECSQQDRFAICQEGGEDWMVDTRLDPNSFWELTESAFAHLICGTREFGHDANRPLVREVHVTHRKPGHWEEYERVLGAPVIFESGRNALLIDKEWHAYRVASTDPYIAEVLTERADKLMLELESTRTIRGRVEAVLIRNLRRGEVGAGIVAEALGLSRKSLYRRLKDENTTYEAVLDELRSDMAVMHLRDEGRPVGETSYMLGFSDPAAFSRAFKRWTGQSPSDFVRATTRR